MWECFPHLEVQGEGRGFFSTSLRNVLPVDFAVAMDTGYANMALTSAPGLVSKQYQAAWVCVCVHAHSDCPIQSLLGHWEWAGRSVQSVFFLTL